MSKGLHTYRKDRYYINSVAGGWGERREEVVSRWKWWLTRFMWRLTFKQYFIFKNYKVLYEGRDERI